MQIGPRCLQHRRAESFLELITMTIVSPARSLRRGNDVLADTKISQVYRALAGREPRRTGSDTWRAPATWRDGDGFNVSLDDARGRWRDFTTGEGGGVLDLVVRVRGGSRRDGLRWVADLVGCPLDYTPLSAADRARWARERRQLERYLQTARHWRRTAIAMTEVLSDALKSQFFNPTAAERPSCFELQNVTRQLARLEWLDGLELVSEYKWWRERSPGMTAALVVVAHQWEQCERAALEEYLGITRTEAAV